MNSMNRLEHRLGSWTPREPSAGLKSGLFPTAGASRPPRPTPGGGADTDRSWLAWQPALNWLASAVGCFLLLGVAWSVREPPASGADGLANERYFARVALSNREMVAYYTAPEHSQRNVWWLPILGWTNAARSHSIGYFPP